MKPRLLDLFCGAGGMSVGYHRAGFEACHEEFRPDRPGMVMQAQGLTLCCAWDSALAVGDQS